MDIVDRRVNNHVCGLDRDVIESPNSILGHELLATSGNKPDSRCPKLIGHLDTEVGSLGIELAISVLAILNIPAVLLQVLDEVKRQSD